MSPHGVPFRNWLTSQVTAFVIQNDNKKPTETHLTPDLERRLVADHREEMGRNLPAGFKDADIRIVYPRLAGAKVKWDQQAFLIK